MKTVDISHRQKVHDNFVCQRQLVNDCMFLNNDRIGKVREQQRSFN